MVLNMFINYRYGERHITTLGGELCGISNKMRCSRMVHSTETSLENSKEEVDFLQPLAITSYRLSDIGLSEDWFSNEGSIPRDTDRILEQIVLMLLRIGIYLKTEGKDSVDLQSLSINSPNNISRRSNNLNSLTISNNDSECSSNIPNSKGNFIFQYFKHFSYIYTYYV